MKRFDLNLGWHTSGRLVAIMAVAMAVVFGTAVRAQVSASISGTVRDSSGAVVPGAAVTVRNLETGAVRKLDTSEGGAYLAPSLSVGKYEVKAEKPGFKTALRTGIDVSVGQEAVVDLKLDVGETRQEVTVTGESPLVNTTTTSIAGLVGERSVKDLPLNGRSFDTLVTLNPGTALITSTANNLNSTGTSSGQGNLFAISGNRGDFNIFLLNGIEYTGVSSTVMLPGGASHQLLGVDGIREFNVLNNNYGAQYGKRPGGQITAITMSGTNQFHGTAFEFLRNSFFDSRNFYDHTLGTPPFKRNQFGASAGGPIKKDKTFIFGNYEGFRQVLATSSVQVVPDNSARLGFLPTGPGGSLQNVGLAAGMAPYFSLWPVPNGPELTGGAAYAYSSPIMNVREDFGTARADQNISQNDMLSGVYTIDDGFNLTPTGPLQQITSDLRSQVVSVQETHVFSPTALMTLRTGYSRAHWIYSTAPPFDASNLTFVEGQPVGSLSIGGNFGGSSSFSGAGAAGNQEAEISARNLFTYSGDMQLTRGNHQLSFGAWFQRVRSNENTADSRYGSAIFGSLASFLAGQGSSVTATLNPAEVGWRQFEGAWYVQDAVKVKSNLNLTLGLRHEFNNGWNSPQGFASNYVLGPNYVFLNSPSVGNSLYTEDHAKLLFSPRVGLAWSPFGQGKTSIHAGFGIYYDMIDSIGDAVDANPVLPSGATVPFNNRVSITNPAFPLLLSPTSLLPGVLPTPNAVQPNFLTPQIQQWNIKIEQGITSNLLLSVGYVGEHGIHLPLTTDLNAAIPQVLSDGSLYVPPKTPRLNPALSNGRDVQMEDNSSYNAMMVDVTRRFSHGFQFRGNYTWSKSLDYLSSTILGGGGGPGGGGALTLLVPREPAINWGPSNFDVRQRFSANFTYEIPAGHGQTLFTNASGLADKLLSGWEMNSIITAQTGFELTPLAGTNRSGDGDTRNPDRVSLNPSFTGPVITGSPNQYYNPAAFLFPAAGTFGNAGKNKYAGPGLTEVDLSIFKTTKVAERWTLQFRAEAFNILNNVNFSLPGPNNFTSSGAVSPTAGVITSTWTTARQLQLALKLIW